jgi:uncharacterized protein YlxW (UPF0749 family)
MRRAAISLTLICLVLGGLAAIQYQSYAQPGRPDLRTDEMRQLLASTLQQNQGFAQQVEDLRQKIRAYETASVKGQEDLELIQSEIENARMVGGLVPAQGPGLVITLSETRAPAEGEDPGLYKVHDEDLLRIGNVLAGAGAEAISINDERLISTSEIVLAGQAITINNTRIAPPYTIKVIGNPSTLESNLRLPYGIVEELTYFGINVDIRRQTNLVVPAYNRPVVFTLAKPVIPEEGQK